MSTKILVTFHKEYPHSKSPVFLNLHVGKQGSKNVLPFVGDNTGEHISDLNSSFCELTGLYWLWKNYDLPDVVGLCHYRRYFDFSNSILQFGRKQRSATASNFDFEGVAKRHEKAADLLQHHDIILPRATNLKESIHAHYVHSHVKEDWGLLVDVVAGLYPSLDLSFFDSSTTLHEFNMFVCRKEQFINYMRWLFPILFEINKRITLSPNSYQKRAIGFMSERLLNLYVGQQQLKVKTAPVIYLKD